MSYREPIVRKKRLWFVTLAYRAKGESYHFNDWIWAKESEDAIELALAVFKIPRDMCWSDRAICAEDFIEREMNGPPEPQKESR